MIISAAFCFTIAKRRIYKSQFIFIFGLGSSKAVVLILNCLFYGGELSCDVNGSARGLGRNRRSDPTAGRKTEGCLILHKFQILLSLTMQPFPTVL